MTDALIEGQEELRHEPNPAAIKRWVNLVQRWQTQTGLSLGRFVGHHPFDNDTSNVDPETGEVITKGPDGWELGEETGHDIQTRELIIRVQDYYWDPVGGDIEFGSRLPMPPKLDRWWAFDEIGPAELKRRRKMHDKLVNAAKALLELRMPLDGYDVEPDENGVYRPKYWTDVDPPDGACWDDLVSSEAKKAALLLANLDNPYANPPRGPGLVTRGKTAARRAVVKELCRLKRKDGRPIGDRALTVLCLLAKPDSFVDLDDDGIPEYLNGQGDWTPVPYPNSVRPDMLFKSAGFLNLERTIRDDLDSGRIGRPRTKPGKSHTKTTD